MPAQPKPASFYLNAWVAILFPFAISALAVYLTSLLFHHHVDFDYVFFLSAPLLVNAVFTWLRHFRPDRTPERLAADSPELTRLTLRKKLLARVGYSSLGLTVAILAFAYGVLGYGNKTMDRALFLIALPTIAGGICIFWAEALGAYIKQRTTQPQPQYLKKTFRPNSPLQSDHWGQPAPPPTLAQTSQLSQSKPNKTQRKLAGLPWPLC